MKNKKMFFLFELNHPKHYYQFKYIMSDLERRGHEIVVLARNKDILLNVLEEEGVLYKIFGKHKKSLWGKIFNTFSILTSYRKILRQCKPDMIVSKASFYGTFLAKLSRIPAVIFPDSEIVWVTNKFVAPLATKIVTPLTFERSYGEKHIRIKGFFENCYLDPCIFTPLSSYEGSRNLKKPYTVLRFIGWTANHDIRNSGFSPEEKRELVQELSKYTSVYISSEVKLPQELEKYKLNVPSKWIHQVLSGADLYIGDSQTMATEAALLGTPAIRSNSFVGVNDMSNFKILENKFHILFNIKEFFGVKAKAVEILTDQNSKEEWCKKRDCYFQTTGNSNEEIVQILLNVAGKS